MQPVDLALENKYGKDVEFIVADVNTAIGNNLAAQYNVDAIPAFFIIDAKGNIIANEVGAQTKNKLDADIAKVVGNQ